MTITGATISGGFLDPELLGTEPAGTNLYAVNEYSDFVDKITVTLTNEDPLGMSYGSILDLSANVTVYGTPITSNELTNNGNVSLNVTYNSPNTFSVVGLNISVTNSGSQGNIYITGNIQNAFPDKYWEYKDFVTKDSIVVDSTFDIPDEDVALHTYKPSFMRYINILFNVEVEYDTATVYKTIKKKVYNDWEINRLAMIAQVDREENYRSNNYPKDY
jgi:hypothetical protein